MKQLITLELSHWHAFLSLLFHAQIKSQLVYHTSGWKLKWRERNNNNTISLPKLKNFQIYAILNKVQQFLIASSFKSRLVDYFRVHIVFWETFGRFMLIKTKWCFWTSWRHFGYTLWRSQLLCSWRNFYFYYFSVILPYRLHESLVLKNTEYWESTA